MPGSQFRERHVTIVGAGIIGVCCALYLQRDGHQVTLVDYREPGAGCSFGNSGQLVAGWCVPLALPGAWRQAPGWLLDSSGPLRIRWQYLPRFAPWLLRLLLASRPHRVEHIAAALAALNRDPLADMRPLVEMAQAEHLIHPGGRLDVCRSERTLAEMEPRLALLTRHGAVVRILDRHEVRALEPGLDDGFECAMYYPETYWTSNPFGLVQALAEAVTEQGGTILKERVTGFQFDRAGPATMLTEAGKQAVDVVVLAAGAYARGLAKQLGASIPLDTERGYHVMLPSSGVTVSRPVVALDHYVGVTPMAEGLRVGGLVEFAGVRAPSDYSNADRLIRSARRMFPELGTDGQVPWMGCRPALPDSMPVIGPSPRYPSVFFAFGHGHHGLGGGARTGRLIADLVSGRSPGIDVTPFAPDRF